MPIYLDQFGYLQTSQSAIEECLAALRSQGVNPDLEVETYAWGVLPAPLRMEDLAEGIATEIAWLNKVRDIA